MENWAIEIQKFDEDLRKRMATIERFERTSLTEGMEKKYVRLALGLRVRTKYGRPFYFDCTSQWKSRHSDECAEHRKNYYKKHRESILKKQIEYKEKNREKLRLKAKEYFYCLSIERKEGLNELRRKRRRVIKCTKFNTIDIN